MCRGVPARRQFAELIREMRRLGITPTQFDLEYSYKFEDNLAESAACIEYFDKIIAEPAPELPSPVAPQK